MRHAKNMLFYFYMYVNFKSFKKLSVSCLIKLTSRSFIDIRLSYHQVYIRGYHTRYN